MKTLPALTLAILAVGCTRARPPCSAPSCCTRRTARRFRSTPSSAPTPDRRHVLLRRLPLPARPRRAPARAHREGDAARCRLPRRRLRAGRDGRARCEGGRRARLPHPDRRGGQAGAGARGGVLDLLGRARPERQRALPRRLRLGRHAAARGPHGIPRRRARRRSRGPSAAASRDQGARVLAAATVSGTVGQSGRSVARQLVEKTAPAVSRGPAELPPDPVGRVTERRPLA